MRVVAFDLDDTLYPEAAYIASGLTAVAHMVAANSPGHDEDSILHEMNRHGGNPFDNIADLCDVDSMVRTYREHKPDISLPEESAEVLSKLKQDGTRLILITDGRSIGQRNKIAALGLHHFFADNDIYISEERGADKHSPDSFTDVMRRYPHAETYTYVGDNPEKDFIHPNLLGWNSVMLRGGSDNVFDQNIDNYPDANRPQIIINSLKELL